MTHRILVLLTLTTAALAAPTMPELATQAAAAGEGTWKRVAQEPPARISSRWLFGYALALVESGQNLDRLPRLCEVAARMQDRDPESRSYGNFRWDWEEEKVLDYNAVDFCMQTGALLWQRHADRLEPAVRESLAELLRYGTEGCLRHTVPSSYTNIALMNAANLIQLGELFERPEVADEGYRRLDGIVTYTWEAGIHEYGSPTYYGVDLEDLNRLAELPRRESGRAAGQALLQLFWTDLAANWFAPTQVLAGPCSRDYDYLRGRGHLEPAMVRYGWLDKDLRPAATSLLLTLGERQPPAELRRLNLERYPRWVRQSWGPAFAESRSHYVLPAVTLGSAAANYGNMDLPLTITFAASPDGVRGYFIPDGRQDPYGKKRIEAGSGHEKTLHLRPFWTAAQDRRDALGLAVYRPGDITGFDTLESHFVLPLKVDALWVGDERIELTSEQPREIELAPGEPVVVEAGEAVAGVKAVWARDRAGQPSAVRFVYDGNTFGAVRLTVTHTAAPDDTQGPAAAAFWVRVDQGVDPTAWRQAFAAAGAEVAATPERIAVSVAGLDGPVSLSAAAPFTQPETLLPEPTASVLELDGVDLGGPLLVDLPPVKQWRQELAKLAPIPVTPAGSLIEAEAGLARSPMTRGDDEAASGGGYIWMPGEVGGRGGGNGSLTLRFTIPEAGTYRFWGRVLSPTPDDDSFFLTITHGKTQLLPTRYWPLGTNEAWTWLPIQLDGDLEPLALELPAGEIELQVTVRENGAKLDRLYLTASPDATPE